MKMKTTRVPDCPPDLVSPGWKIELIEGGKSISRLWIVDRTMRIGGAQVKLGGISTLGADDAFRGKGRAQEAIRPSGQDLQRPMHPPPAHIHE